MCQQPAVNVGFLKTVPVISKMLLIYSGYSLRLHDSFDSIAQSMVFSGFRFCSPTYSINSWAIILIGRHCPVLCTMLFFMISSLDFIKRASIPVLLRFATSNGETIGSHFGNNKVLPEMLFVICGKICSGFEFRFFFSEQGMIFK